MKQKEIVAGKIYGGRTRVKRPRRVTAVENGRVRYVNLVTGETGVSTLPAFAHWAGRYFRDGVFRGISGGAGNGVEDGV